MRWLLGLLVIYGVIKLLLLALGFGIGLLLHWLVPSIDLGIGVLIGVVATGFSVQFFGRITSLPLPDFGQDIEQEPELEPPPTIVYVDPPSSRRKGRRRQQ
ncbi:MAG: hypothetical protein ACJ8CR_00915 [Roseiflexaceae bacterium]